MLKVWTRTVLFIQRVLHLHNCTCTCRTSHQSVAVFFPAVKRVVFRQHKPFIYTCCVYLMFCFLGSECFFLSFEHKWGNLSVPDFLKKKICRKKRKRTVCPWTSLPGCMSNVHLMCKAAAPARRHCEGCYVPSAAWKRSFQCHGATPEAAWVVSFTCEKKTKQVKTWHLKGKQNHGTESCFKEMKSTLLRTVFMFCYECLLISLASVWQQRWITTVCLFRSVAIVFFSLGVSWWGCFVFTASAACLFCFLVCFFSTCI